MSRTRIRGRMSGSGVCWGPGPVLYFVPWLVSMFAAASIFHDLLVLYKTPKTNAIFGCFQNTIRLLVPLQARQCPWWFYKINSYTFFWNCYRKSILCEKFPLDPFFDSSSSRFHIENIFMHCCEFLCHLSKGLQYHSSVETRYLRTCLDAQDFKTSSLTLKNENDCFLSAHLSSSLIITWNSWLIKGCFTRKSFLGFRPISILVAFKKLAQFSNAMLLYKIFSKFLCSFSRNWTIWPRFAMHLYIWTHMVKQIQSIRRVQSVFWHVTCSTTIQ